MTRCILIGLALVLSIGCGGKHDIAPVSGVITMDGKPLKNAHVNFAPIGDKDNVNPGPGSYGKTDGQGRFTLRLVSADDDSKGAIIGKHRVSISKRNEEEIEFDDAGGTDVPLDPVPPRYNTDTELKFDVPAEGTTKANFKLSSKRNVLAPIGQ